MAWMNGVLRWLSAHLLWLTEGEERHRLRFVPFSHTRRHAALGTRWLILAFSLAPFSVYHNMLFYYTLPVRTTGLILLPHLVDAVAW
jgi:hypothetical protein